MPAQMNQNEEVINESGKPRDYLSGMFAYQVNLLVQYYSKQAQILLERVLNPETEKS